MSTITKAIAAVEFQANSRQANAAMESIRSSAKECRDEVERLQADLAKGIEVTMVAGQEMDINKRIKQLEGMAKSYDQAADSLIKGVKAFDELWKHAQAGNIESMTAAQIRAGMNGAKRVKDQLKLNDPEDRLKNAAIQSMTDEGQKVLDKMKLNTDGIIQQLERGESVAKDVLEREQKGLLALMDQLEHGSKEWQIYNAQLVRISKGYDDLIIRERQLKGEIVTREDAIRVANQNDKKATDDAIKNAQQRIDAAQEVIKTKQEEVRTNQVAAEQAAQNLVGVREEIKNKKEEIEQAKANGEAMKKEARERVSAANERKNAAVKNAKEEQQAYNTLNGEVTKLRGEVSGLEAQLAALDQPKAAPQKNPTIEGIKQGAEQAAVDVDALKKKLEELANEKKDLEIKMSNFRFDEKMAAAFDKDLDKRTQKVLEQIDALPNTDVGKRVIIQGDKRFSKKNMLIAKNQDFNYEYERAKFDALEFKSNIEGREGIIDDRDELSKKKALDYWKKQYEAMRDAVSEGKRLLEVPENQANPATVKELERRVALMEQLKAVYKETYDMLRQYGNKISEQWGNDIYEEKVSLNTKEKEATQKRINEIDQQSLGIQNQITAATENETEAYKQQKDELDGIEQKLSNISKLKGESQKVVDDFEAKYGKTEDERFEKQEALRTEAIRKDEEARKQGVEEVEQKWQEYWRKQEEQAKQFAATLGKSLEELDLSEISKHLEGPQAAKAKSAYRVVASKDYELGEALFGEGELNQDKEWAKRYEGDDSPTAKIIESMQRKYREYIKDVREAEKVDTEAAAVRKKLTEENTKYFTALGELEGYQQVENKLLEQKAGLQQQGTQAQKESTAATEEHTQAAEKDAATEQKREELKSKLATANGKLAEKEQELNVQTDKTITANQNLRQAEDDVKQATEQKNEVYMEAKRVVADGEDAVERLEKKEEEYAETQKKATQAVAEGTAEINKQSAAQVAAQQEIDQATANSIEKKEQAIKVLEQLNREINDPGNADWQENERTIGRLKQQLEDLRKQSAELRREPLLKEMTERMTDIKNLSVDALGETKKFWEAMYNGADRNDAKLKDFKQHLDDIAAEERRRTEERGKEAMSFFNDRNVFAGVDAEGNQIFRTKAANASAAETVEMAKAMEAYRDSLPKEEGAETIANINRLLEENAEAIKVATGEWMSYTEAEQLASEAAQAGKGEGNFIATAQQMQQAQQAVQREYDKTIKSLQQLERAETKDQAAIDKEKQKLQLLEKQLKDLKFEQDNFNMSHEKMQQLLSEPTKATDLEELRAAIKRADGELRRMKDSLGDGSKQYQEFAAKVKEAKNQLKEIESQSKATTSAWDKAWSRLKTYVGMYMGFNMAWQRITGTADDLMQLSDKLGEVRKTTGFTADEVGRLSDNLRKMDTRTAITGLLDLSVAAGQLGLKTEEDVMGFTEAANKLTVALPEMGQEGATQMLKVALATGEIAKIEKQMQEGLIEGSSATAVAMEKVGSTIDRLRATSAATAPAITDFVKRVGAVGAQSGISIDQVAALGSTVDALGMRVEMSATALSRMIPAIKNNAFQVAKAIGMAPNALRDLFDEAGGGMKAMLAIFQHIKDAGMDEDSIEKMLGMAGMQEVMKELNQQGARAGIVFAGLSQNVDVLRAHLETAADAYEKNVAIQQEYDKMNETTLAKWQRLKNEIEEAFVSDGMQRSLGWLIDRLRDLVNLITGNVEPAFKSLNIVLWMTTGYFLALKAEIGRLVVGAFGGLVKGLIAIKNGLIAITTVKGLKGIRENLWLLYDETKKYIALKWQLVLAHNAEEKAAIRAKIANNALGKSLNANVILAVVAAIGMLVWKMHEWHEKAMEGAREAAKFQAELDKETKKVDELFNAVGKATVKVNEAQKEVDKANKTLKEAQEQADGTKESTDKLAKAEANLAEKEEDLKNKQAVHAKTINDINSVYGKYLGFMLSEVSTAQELANAREMINEKLRETITLKRKEAALERVENEEGEERDTKYANLFDIVTKNSYTKVGKGKLSRDAGLAATMMRDITDLAQNDYKSSEEFRDAIVKMLGGGQYKGNVGGVDKIADQAEAYYKQLSAIRKKNQLVEKQFMAEEAVNRKKSQDKLETQYQEATKNYKQLELNYQNAKGDAKKQAAANLLKEMDTITEMVDNAEKHFETDEKKGYVRKDQNGKRLGTEKDRFDKFVKDTAGTVVKMKEQREALLKEAGNLYQARETVTGDITSHIPEANPWGNKLEGSSTDWKNMTADQLVNRRKQMNEFVNAIQTDSDVQSVLGEDAALKKAIEKGMSSDMRTVINWYNTERLKIQDELHARYLTNTGAWMDPKQSRARKKMLRDETRTYLDELDAYYTERKAKIQEAAVEEGISEAEVKNRTLVNEAEWRQRRMELQKMYGEKAKDVAQDEQDAIFAIIAERTEEDVTVVKGMYQKTLDFVNKIEKTSSQGAKEAHEFRAKMDKQAMQDFNKEQAAIHQQMKSIQDIIDKERPFNGITKNLRENLVTMGILTADMSKERDRLMKENEDMTDFNARQAAEELKRTAFMLGEAENAYTTTIEDVMRRMAAAGMKAWADELRKSPEMQEGMMAQLHSTYDAIQEAIKKEASLMKKQAETMWNNILLPGGDGKTTIKDAYETAISQLGVDQGRVSRANSLIGAGASSDRVADKLAIKQMQLQLSMQEHYYNLMRKQGLQRINDLKRQADELERQGELEEASRKRQDQAHAEMSLRLATTKEQTELLKQQEEIIARTEESQNRLYTSLREWTDLLSSSFQSMMEASHAGDAEYYNELAKMELTGKGGPGAGTYIVIDNEGTSDARAHYEYLDQRQALERQRDIERQNAQAEAFKKMWDDINNKMNEQITDWINASMQNASVDANTSELKNLETKIDEGKMKVDDNISVIKEDISATKSNTDAIIGLTEKIDDIMSGKTGETPTDSRADLANALAATETPDGGTLAGDAMNLLGNMLGVISPGESRADYANSMIPQEAPAGGEAPQYTPSYSQDAELWASNMVGVESFEELINASDKNAKKQKKNNKDVQESTQSMFAKMTAAANMYGVAYQAMSNDNLSAAQKFEMIALQAAGQTAITMLTTNLAQEQGKQATQMPGILGKLLGDMPYPAAMAAYALVTALMGGLMGLAVSKVAKSKSQIAQVTGASSSAGRLATGMLTYAEGNVNEFTDPASLTPGRSYNVDGADGKTYRAKYTGTRPTTHLTNGPEFHLAGEKGREMIIDAGTTRQITMNDNEIWKAIKTLSGGGRVQSSRRRRSGVRAFAEGNVDDFDTIDSGAAADELGFDPAALQASIDRNSEVMERALTEGIKGVFNVYGPDGLVAAYDKGKKNANRHGEKY